MAFNLRPSANADVLRFPSAFDPAAGCGNPSKTRYFNHNKTGLLMKKTATKPTPKAKDLKPKKGVKAGAKSSIFKW